MSQRPVTLTDIVAGHVSLDIERFDRIYLNGYVPALQTGGQVAGFLHWRGLPIASPGVGWVTGRAAQGRGRRGAALDQVAAGSGTMVRRG